MDQGQIASILSTPSAEEAESATSLRQQAYRLISASDPLDTLDKLPQLLLQLLDQVVKPLFQTATHSALTQTGRKNLAPPPPPSLTARFATLGADAKPWKCAFTAPLLTYVLSSYARLGPSQRKSAIEAHFHFLVPPILHHIDDADAASTAAGCRLLHTLCDVVSSVQSNALRRTGLASVFVDALQTNFLLLPTLTPEEDSLLVLHQLYPAYLSLLDATYEPEPTPKETVVAELNGTGRSTGTVLPAESQQHLTLLYRHGVMASLSHLSSSSYSFSSTMSAPLTALLLRQIPPIFARMGISSARHLQTLLPMLRVGLMDPFSLAAPDMLRAMLQVLESVIDVCAPRVRDKWWPEILRGLVGCWGNCLEAEGFQGPDLDMPTLTQTLRKLADSLREVAPKTAWEMATRELIKEEANLAPLLAP